MQYPSTYAVCGLLIYLLVPISADNLDVGDTCQITTTNEPGICKPLLECVEALNDLKFHARLPTECGYIGFNKIVCCPIRKIVKVVVDDPDSNLPIAVRKCKDYSRYVFTNFSLLYHDAESSATQKSISNCGHTKIPLIIGGEPASAREFPHSALLGYRMANGELSWECGGSLVSRRYILTAAHCLTSSQHKVNVSRVRLGELVLNNVTDDDAVIDIPVEQIIPHPEYLKKEAYNDIALLKLNRRVKLSPYILPICLPTVNSDTPKSIATGWGIIEHFGERSNALLKVVLESYTNTECNEIFQPIQGRKYPKGIIETQLCAGSRTEIKDTCEGDSGGPLQIYHSNIYCMYTQIGITSFGIGCGYKFPGVYTRVYSYAPWIESIIWAPGEDD